jgi:hypothetical protein
MPGDTKRSVLSDLRRPLLQPPSTVSAALEEKLLGVPAVTPSSPPPASAVESGEDTRSTRGKVPTVPVTFHLPIALRDRLKLTAQAQQRTMVDLASEALEQYLDHHPVSEAAVRRLLGL